MTEKNEGRCEHCGAQMKIWKHRLTPGLAKLLVKMIVAVKDSGKNDVHIQKAIDLTRSQDANFQKLRYFGLVAKVKGPDGKHIRGHWLITWLGAKFLRGDAEVPAWVKSWRNHIYERSETLVTFRDILREDAEYFQQEFPHDIFFKTEL